MKKSTKPPARAAIAGAALFIVATFSTCDFLTADIFPRWLSYVEASVDFRGILVDQGLGADASIENLEFAPYVTGANDYSKVLVFAVGNGTKRLILLDPENLAFVEAKYDANMNRVLASVTGSFFCGQTSISPLTYAVSAGPPWMTGNIGIRVFRVGDPVTGLNYAVVPGVNNALFTEYDDTLTAVPTHSITGTYDLAGNPYNLLDADFTSNYSLLARRQDNSNGYAASLTTGTLFTTSNPVFDFAVVKTGPFPVADDMAWLTEGGPVAYYRGDKGVNRLVRYEWGTGDFTLGTPSTEADSLPFDSNDMRILSFDPTGTWWFIYDRLDGRLYKLRTWW